MEIVHQEALEMRGQAWGCGPKLLGRTSLVAWWLRIHLPVQATQLRSLVREDPTCHRATKPVHHNNWACTLEPTSHNYWAHMLQLLKPTWLDPVLCNERSHPNEKPTHCNEEQPPLAATRESPCTATKTQCSQKKQNKTNKKQQQQQKKLLGNGF